MKISKLLLLSVLSFSLINFSVAMEKQDNLDPSETTFDDLAIELQCKILEPLIIPLINSGATITQVREAIKNLSLVSKVFRKSAMTVLNILKENKNFKELLDAEAYVKKNPEKAAEELIGHANGDFDRCKFLILGGVDLDAQDTTGHTALLAASKGHHDIIKLLIANNANLNLTNLDGDTALIFACACSQKKVVKLLLKNKAGVNIKNNEGKTALNWAVNNVQYEIVKLLLDAGAEISDSDIEDARKITYDQQKMLHILEEHRRTLGQIQQDKNENLELDSEYLSDAKNKRRCILS